jgi:hypothetical protein
MPNPKKLFVWFVALFVLFEVLVLLSLLDFPPLNLIDYEDIGINIENILGFGVALAFFIGPLLGVKIILSADDTFPHLRKTKFITSLFYILSPLGFLVGWFLFAAIMNSGSLLSSEPIPTRLLPVVAQIIIFPLLFIGLLVLLYRFDISWSKGKKTFFTVYTAIMQVISSIAIFFITVLGMHDGSLS